MSAPGGVGYFLGLMSADLLVRRSAVGTTARVHLRQ